MACSIALFLTGCSSKKPESSSNITLVSEDSRSTEFQEALYAKLMENSKLSSTSLEVSASTIMGQTVHVVLYNYDTKAFSEAISVSSEFIKSEGTSFGLPSPKLTVVAGDTSSNCATWSSEDLETGIWTDTSSLNIGGKFPLKALQGTYIPGSTDDKAVYVEQGGHWIVYHSKYDCPELAKEAEAFNSFPIAVAMSVLSEKYKPCEDCII